MSIILTRGKFILILVVIFLLPTFFVRAENQICSPDGYTVLTINGIFTNEKEAKKNKDRLMEIIPLYFNGEPIVVDYLHNESHLAGFGDILKSIYQGLFDSETVKDYDLVEMLQDASEKVTTQKLLLVAHSQGNFYANSFYDVVADKDGGIPSQSLAIYSVATPSSRVASGDKWITSDTDKVIAGLVARIQFTRKILPPNVHIELQEGDSSSGHGFSDIYLKYQGERIVSDIGSLLDQLKTNNIQDAQKPCLAPPKLSIVHKIKGVVFAIADPVVSGVAQGAATVVKMTYNCTVAVGQFVYKTTVTAAQTTRKTINTIGNFFSNRFGNSQDSNFKLAQVFDLTQNQNQQNQISGETKNNSLQENVGGGGNSLKKKQTIKKMKSIFLQPKTNKLLLQQ